MKVLGIVAEYDPFHHGHLYHLTEAKRQVSPDLTYIVLSPCIKQRGSLALLSPVDRARCALEAGADGVGGDAVLGDLTGQVLGEAQDCGLGGGVGAVGGQRGGFGEAALRSQGAVHLVGGEHSGGCALWEHREEVEAMVR